VTDDLRVWVVDTSSLIQIRQSGLSLAEQAKVFKALTARAQAGLLLFPPQVREELEWNEPDRPNDAAREWVRSVRSVAERAADFATVKRVLARAPLLIDVNSKRDQADPYVIALALDSQSLGGVSILSDDRRDRSDGRGGHQKLSVATVAGLWDILVVPLAGFMLRNRR
jgi:hypothetical protein